ncbi:MAG: glycosyltransferase [Chitinophagia bacterium]
MLTYGVILLASPLFLYSFWQIIGIFISTLTKKNVNNDHYRSLERTKVAILYPTCDDFSASACESLLLQTNVEFHLYILDDSRLTNIKNEIDIWAKLNLQKVTIIRRPDRNNFKGGNINNWLFNHCNSSCYLYILVVDADEILPSNFTVNLLNRIQSGNWSFVQAGHNRVVPDDKSMNLSYF